MQLEKDLQAARATMLALGAVLFSPDAVSPPLSVTLNGRVIPRDEVISRLANLPKPLACSAVGQNGQFALQCKTIQSERERTRFDRWVSVTVAPDLEFIQRMYGGERKQPRILLRGAAESLTLSIEEYEHWLRTYDLEEVNSAMEIADGEARAEGATALLTFHGSALRFDLDLPAPREE